MSAGAWPEIPLPAPHGPTATEHLEQIRSAAQAARAANRDDVDAAVDACLRGMCLQPGSPPQRGKPPHDQHGSCVLLALVHALESDWDRCLVALRHGESEPSRKQKA